MKYTKAALLITLVFFLCAGLAFAQTNSKTGSGKNKSSAGKKTAAKKAPSKKTTGEAYAKVRKLINDAAKAPPPQNSAILSGTVANIIPKSNYICPKDNTRNEYPLDSKAARVIGELSLLERQLPYLNDAAAAKGIDVKFSFNANSLCKKHSPKAKDYYILLVSDYKGNPKVSSRVTMRDMKLLIAFFNGSEFYEASETTLKPIKDGVPKLRTLLLESKPVKKTQTDSSGKPKKLPLPEEKK